MTQVCPEKRQKVFSTHNLSRFGHIAIIFGKRHRQCILANYQCLLYLIIAITLPCKMKKVAIFLLYITTPERTYISTVEVG